MCLRQRSLAITSEASPIISIYSFRDSHIKKAIHAIKYSHRKDLIHPLVQKIITDIRKRDYSSYVLMPIPMPRLRKYIRGHNHAETIAQVIGKQVNIPVVTTTLIRLSSKKRQVKTISRKERFNNLHNTFTLQESVSGMNIILIDDVTTTGATLLEARKKLLTSGALHVIAYTIAH
jgi:competence protein ComFC